MTTISEKLIARSDYEINILVVDNNLIFCKNLTQKFLEHGYSSDIAFSGLQAFEKADEADFNLAVLDLELPDMNGTELLENFVIDYSTYMSSSSRRQTIW